MYKKVATEAVISAGDILLKDRIKLSKFENKKEGFDILTSADKESEKIIVNALHKKFPSHTIISEEGAYIKGNEYKWIIDPLDGSNHYLRGLPLYAVTLALKKDGELLLGITYIPTTKELFIAEKGKGSFLNNSECSISKTSELEKAVVYIEMPARNFKVSWSKKEFTKAMRIQQKIAKNVLRLRAFGSGPIGMAYTAMGAFDAYIRLLPLNVDDVIAGKLLIQESGGIVTDLKNNILNLDSDNHNSYILASNRILHKKILEVVNNR